MMEAVAAPISTRSHAEDLLSPALRVPLHEPTLHVPQPCDPLSVDATSPSPGANLDSTRISTCQIVPIDSVHNSLDRDDSQVWPQPSQAPLPIATQGDVVSRAASTDTQTVETECVQEQEIGTQREGESHIAPSHNAHERLVSTLSTKQRGSAIEIQQEDAGPSEHPAPEDMVHGRDVNLLHPSQESSNQREQEQTQLNANPMGESARTEQSSGPQPRVATSLTHITTPRQPYLKFLFWKRYRTSRSKEASKCKLPVRAQPSIASASPSEHITAPGPAASSSNTTSSAGVPPASQDTLFNHAVNVPAASPHLYMLEDGTYIGKLRYLSPPATVEATWSSTTRKRLTTDLRPVLASLPQTLSRDETIIELELCMSGRIEAASNNVRLSPSIWIRCGSKRCRDEIRKAVADLSYLRAFQVHFRLDAPRFACHSTRCPSSVVRRATETPAPSSGRNLSTGAIVGIAVGCVCGLGMLLAFALMFRKRKKHELEAQMAWEVPKRPPVPPHRSLVLDSELTGPDHVPNSYLGSNPPCSPHYSKVSSMQPTLPPVHELSAAEGLYSRIPPLLPPVYPPTPEMSDVDSWSIDRRTSNYDPSSQSLPSYVSTARSTPAHELFDARRTGSSVNHSNRTGTTYSGIASMQLPFYSQREHSTCGLRVIFYVWDGNTFSPTTSTIGGFIQLNGTVYGLTTAHSMFEVLLTYGRAQENTSNDQQRHQIEFSVTVVGNTRATSAVRHIGALGYGDRYLWSDAAEIPSIIMDSHVDSFKSNPELHGSDFALIHIGNAITPLNSYKSLASGPSIRRIVREIASTLSSGDVSILLSQDEVCDGFLLEGSAQFMDRTGTFETRKIHTEEKLGKGSSGAWVVRGTYLLGMIVAVYDNEPYAHMLPMQQVFADVRTAYTDGATSTLDVDITLPAATPTRAATRGRANSMEILPAELRG